MPNNNPQGINAFGGGGFAHEEPYGAIERLKTLTKAAPNMPQANPRPSEAPRRAQRRAVKGQQAAPAPPAPAPPPADAPYPQMLQAFWNQLASEAGASDLIREYAQDAARG